VVEAWPIYGVGIVLVLAGFGAMHRWLQGITGARSEAPGPVLAASAVAFLVGSAVLGTAILIDSDQVRIESTRIFLYEVTVIPDGTTPMTILLPGPSDSRVFGDFNRTSGASSLSLVGPLPDTVVRLVASGPLTFEVRIQLVGSALNRTLLGANPGRAPAGGTLNATGSISIAAPGVDPAGAQVSLTIRFVEYCTVAAFSLDANAVRGTSAYPASWSTTATGVCG